MGLQTISYREPQLWNLLLSEIRNSLTLSIKRRENMELWSVHVASAGLMLTILNLREERTSSYIIALSYN